MADDDVMQTPLQESATQVHELFVSLVGAGFAEDQALYLVAQMMGNANG